MTYDLYIGDRMFSSWSLRGWLMFSRFGILCRTHMVGLYSGTMAEDLAHIAPARLVPAIRTPDGTVVGESLAMAETLADAHPDAGLWPSQSGLRATARWLSAEMVAGFSNLRADCPMQLARCYMGFQPSGAVLADLNRIETLWSHARSVSGVEKGWLFGDYCLADVFYTPVAARIIGYGLPVSDAARAYALALLAVPEVQSWRREALEVTYTPEPYALDLPSTAWPAA
ncbi:MAG: glutathione S-transferase [Pseudomonadota bacterium]